MEYTSIKNFEDACKALNQDATILPDVSMLDKSTGDYLLNQFKLITIVKAINPTGWQPDFGNHDQWKYFPYFYSEEGHVPGSAGGFSFRGCGRGCTRSPVGARLSFSDRGRAEYAGRTFVELYEKVLLIFP